MTARNRGTASIEQLTTTGGKHMESPLKAETMNRPRLLGEIEEIADDLHGLRIISAGLAVLADGSEIEPVALNTITGLVARAEGRLREVLAEAEEA